MTKHKAYLIGYDYSNDSGFKIVCCTLNKSKAYKWRAKFNRILKKWREYYLQFEENELGVPWIKREYAETKYYRWYRLRDIQNAFVLEIELR